MGKQDEDYRGIYKDMVEVLGYEKGLDGRGWYSVKKGNGLKGFAAAQFIDLR